MPLYGSMRAHTHINTQANFNRGYISTYTYVKAQTQRGHTKSGLRCAGEEFHATHGPRTHGMHALTSTHTWNARTHGPRTHGMRAHTYTQTQVLSQSLSLPLSLTSIHTYTLFLSLSYARARARTHTHRWWQSRLSQARVKCTRPGTSTLPTNRRIWTRMW